MPGGTGLSPDLIARITRLEEYVATARLQGPFASTPAALPYTAATMPHIADLGPDVRTPMQSAEAGRAAGTGRTLETRPAASETSGAPASVRATVERGRTMESRTPNGSPERRAVPQPRRPGDVDLTIHRTTEARHNGTSSLGWLWALPLAALAGLGLYFLQGSPTDRLGDSTPITAGTDLLPTVSAPDLQRQALAAIQSLTNTLQGVTDRTSATTAMPKIQDAAKEMERLAMLGSQLPADARTALADATRNQLGKLNTVLDNTASLPGVGPLLQPAVAGLRGRMDAIAMVPGRPLFLASAPAGWVPLSSFYNRDVQNPAGERLGTASGFYIGSDGKLVASLVSVDRQLGIGDRQIGLPFAGGQLVRRGDGWHLVIDTTKDDLQHATAFEAAK
jgi:hypothetical protein